jgi:4-amino-4-deoxy-L-arabinose transferase-like glycosyltransferase
MRKQKTLDYQSITNRDWINLGFIVLYSLIFLILRLSASCVAMTLDEAELFLDAQAFKLGFDDQPPLYSWIIRALSLIFGLNVPLMVVVNQALICAFLITIYFILRSLWDRERSWLVLLSYVFIFLYSYDFYRYMIHTTLMVFISALSFLLFIKLLYRPKTIYYALLGLLMGLGILAKYNFVFFVFLILLVSLTNRLTKKRLFNKKTFVFLLFFSLTITPHSYWLLKDGFSAFAYTLGRGDSGNLASNFLEVLLDFVWQPLIYILIFFVFFRKEITFSKNPSRTNLNKIFFALFVFAYLIPFICVVSLKLGNFSQRWLAPVNFLLPIICFSRCMKLSQHKLFKYLCLGCLGVIFCVKFIAFHLPNLYQKTIFIHIPHRQIFTQLKQNLEEDSNSQ